ncbi:MAG: hypothetical protein LBU81_07110 [Methanosarcinales archaeon]|nr:hypothetical protein [Methanosarcinales archaeon]
MLNVKVTFCAPVYITEDSEKVSAAVSNMVNFGRPKSEENRAEFEKPGIGDENIKQTARINGNLELLSGIHYLIRKEEIIDTVNTALKDGIDDSGCKTRVALNKQAALMKHLSFPADDEPLGSVYLTIEAETQDALLKIIDWLTPPTKEGVPVYELKMKEL